ncbi:MAG TPA: BrnA antitoxin family protein [Pyrinomonadaceae bacterium]
MTDEEIDTSDIPPLDETFFDGARLRLPAKTVSVTLDVDADVLEWFKAQGEDFQARVNAALKIYAEAHKQPHR